MGLQIKLASYNILSLLGLLCTTFLAVPHRHSSSLHDTPFFSIRSCAHSFLSVIFLGSKKHFFPCGVVCPISSHCLQSNFSRSLSLVYCVPLLVKALSCTVRRLISCCYLATLSTYTARLAAKSASGPLGYAVWGAAASRLFR